MKKCPVCGSENIYGNGDLIYAGVNRIPIEGFTCVDCGYVMLFSPKLAQEGKKSIGFNDYLKNKFTLINEILDKNFPDKTKPDAYKLNSLNKQLLAVTKVIYDENQTVKAVKEAQQQKKELEEQINAEHNVVNEQTEYLEKIAEIKLIFSVNECKELLPCNSPARADVYETHIKQCLDKFCEQLYSATRLYQVYTLIEQLKRDLKRM